MKVIISGTTGVGKTTTVEELKRQLEAKGKEVIVKGELVLDSPYFDLYFNNLSEWGFLAQLDFLFERFHQYISTEQDIRSKNNNTDTIIIFDRHFLEDIAFAELRWVRQNTAAPLTNAYKVIYKSLIKKINEFEKPEYFFLLKASFDTVMERMIARGREIELTFHEKYWQDLYYRYYAKRSYRNIFKQYTNNFVEIDIDGSTPEESASRIIKYINNRTGL